MRYPLSSGRRVSVDHEYVLVTSCASSLDSGAMVAVPSTILRGLLNMRSYSWFRDFEICNRFVTGATA